MCDRYANMAFAPSECPVTTNPNNNPNPNSLRLELKVARAAYRNAIRAAAANSTPVAYSYQI